MEVQDYQILDQYSDEQVWCPSQLLTLMPHLCVVPTEPHIVCSPRWHNTSFCLNWYNSRYIYHLTLHFYQAVFYATYDQNSPSEREERAGYWVGFGEHCGDAMSV